jgi:hypothetical protein
MQYVKWDYENNKILIGPQYVKVDDNWVPFIEIGELVNSKTQHAELYYDESLGAVVKQIVGPPKLLTEQLRAAEYGPLREQLDKLWHDINNNTLNKDGQFYNFIAEVKNKYPKESQ